MSAAAKANGQLCARCGMKSGAHDWPNMHPKACSEWVDQYDLDRDRDEAMHGWMLDTDMEAKS